MEVCNVIEKNNLWIIVELIVDKKRKFTIGCVYLRANLSHDTTIDSLNSVSDNYRNHKLIIVGDYNAHIEQMNQIEDFFFHTLYVHEYRNSMHEKCNYPGRKLVDRMQSLGLYVLNGRTEGDIP